MLPDAEAWLFGLRIYEAAIRDLQQPAKGSRFRMTAPESARLDQCNVVVKPFQFQCRSPLLRTLPPAVRLEMPQARSTSRPGGGFVLEQELEQQCVKQRRSLQVQCMGTCR